MSKWWHELLTVDLALDNPEIYPPEIPDKAEATKTSCSDSFSLNTIGMFIVYKWPILTSGCIWTYTYIAMATRKEKQKEEGTVWKTGTT